MDACEYITAHQDRFLEQLQDLLRIPSVSALSEHRPDVARAAEWVADDLRAIGLFEVRVIGDEEQGGHPLVYAEWQDAPGRPTVLLYGHYDVQPPDPLELWQSPPFQPTVRGQDLYARGASDDKGQMLALLKGVESVLQTQGRLPVNLKVLIEGEEEVSGQHIERFVRAHPDLLRADAVLIADSPLFAPGVPVLCTGLRGMVYTALEAQGAAHDLHSGLYGGTAPNALNGLAAILAGLKDAYSGRIAIPGFYDRVAAPTDEERAAWATLPFDEETYLRDEVGASALSGRRGLRAAGAPLGAPHARRERPDRRLYRRGRQDGYPGASDGQGEHAPGSPPGPRRDFCPVRASRRGTAPAGDRRHRALARRRAAGQPARRYTGDARRGSCVWRKSSAILSR